MEQRKISFRAWDNKLKRFWYNIESSDYLQEMVPPDFEEFCFADFLADKERFVVEQFTGIIDRYGEDIYEGDHFGDPDCPVEFEDGSFILYNEPLTQYGCRGLILVGTIHGKTEDDI